MPNDPNEPVFPPANDDESREREATAETRSEGSDDAKEAEEGEEHEEGEGVEEGEEEAEDEESSEDPEPATPTAEEGPQIASGAQVRRIHEEEDFPTLVTKVFSERGSVATGASYAGHLRRFLTWCATKGIDTRTMPPDTAVKYLQETYNNPVTRNQANLALRASLGVGEQYGLTIVSKQDIPKPGGGKKTKKPAQEMQTNKSPVREGSLFDVPVSPPGQDAPRVSQNVESARVSQSRTTPGIPKSRTGVQPLGQRIRISKRADGTEGVPPGSLILVGVYNASDLEGEGAVEEFIANRIRPLYGPKPGALVPALYYVDRLDNMGQPIPNATIQVPVMPPLTDPNAVHPQAQQGYQFPQPPILNQQSAAQGATFDTFLTYLMKKQDEAEKKYEQLLAQMQTTAQQKGVDPTMLMLLMQQARPQPLDIGKAAEEWKRANPGAEVKFGRRKTDREPEPTDDPFFPQGARGGLAGTPTFPGRGMPPPGAFGGFEPAEHHERDSVIAEALRQNSQMMQTLMERIMSNVNAAPQQSARDLFEMFSTFARAIQPQERPPDPVQQRLIEVALSKLTEGHQPSGGIKETIAALRELRDAGDLLGGEEKPLGFGDIVMAAVEHADQIGGALGQVLSSLPRAPKLPVTVPVRMGGIHGPANGTAHPTQQRKAPPQIPPMPPEAQAAFVALQTEQNPQIIVNHLFTILMSYEAVNADHWKRVTKATVDAFKSATTRAEIAACVTNLYKFSGAMRALNESVLERVTSTLTEHYSLIYEQLTGGGQKGLGDVQPIATPTPTTAVSPEAQQRGAAMARNEPPDGTAVSSREGEAVYEDEEPTMTLPVGGVGNPSGAGTPPPLFGG